MQENFIYNEQKEKVGVYLVRSFGGLTVKVDLIYEDHMTVTVTCDRMHDVNVVIKNDEDVKFFKQMLEGSDIGCMLGTRGINALMRQIYYMVDFDENQLSFTEMFNV